MRHAARQFPSWLIFDVGRAFVWLRLRSPECILASESRRVPGRAAMTKHRGRPESLIIRAGSSACVCAFFANVRWPQVFECTLAFGRPAFEARSQIGLPCSNACLPSGLSLHLFTASRPSLFECISTFQRCSLGKAQQGARANAHIGHASCYRNELRIEAPWCMPTLARVLPAVSVAHL